MQFFSKRFFFRLTVSLAALFAVGSQFSVAPPAAAQEGTTASEVSAQTERPFQLPFAEPASPEIVAIADGVVFAVDGPFGSPPHNLMIDHPQLGYASMYGHLLEVPDLEPGQTVKQGEVVALVGDSGETCYSRPHLHLEIRDLGHTRKYNPQLLIEANWGNLALVGSSGRDFARDLAEPRKWQPLPPGPSPSGWRVWPVWPFPLLRLWLNRLNQFRP